MSEFSLMFSLSECLNRIATRNPGRTEADIQADIRDILLYGSFDLGDEQVHLESPAPDRRRIDVEAGALVIECKRDLRQHRVLSAAETQLFGYLRDREVESGGSYVGVLSDGCLWRAYRTRTGGVDQFASLELRAGQIDERRFRWWLGSMLATERQLMPTAGSILERLGSESPGCQLALKELLDLWESAHDRLEVQLKRSLWAKLLRTALGTQFEDDDSLFVEHTYLVLISTLIAHAVIGFDFVEMQEAPNTVLSGQLFARHGIRGVGEAGFFDWVLDVPGGSRIVAELARRLSVFTWSGVDHDVLKALYQSVIAPDTRHRLGEYYTPDWLSRSIVRQIVTEPLSSRVLDPACGSGTFLFHAIRKYLDAADSAGMSLGDAVSGVIDHVFGMDLHPVAVVLAQVTYLLAIGTERATRAGVPLSIPVYLGDSMRWEIADETFLAQSGEIVIPTDDGHTLFQNEELRFPASVVSDPARFDRLVDELATRAANRRRGDRPLPVASLLSNFGLNESDRSVLEVTYKHLCDLHDQNRNHIWGFFVRNQARPTWFASTANRVDVLVGNPPWLSFRYMTPELQATFRRRAMERNLWVGGGRGRSTQQDLSSFFVARSIELYLRIGGRFGFVMPLAALSRQTYSGFRAGDFPSMAERTEIAFDVPWDLDEVEPDPFPVPASVVFGERVSSDTSSKIVPLPRARLAVRGRIDSDLGARADESLSWETVEPHENQENFVGTNSPYARRFRQGAILAPRFLILVDQMSEGPLQSSVQASVRSRRGRLDKEPWRSLPSLTGTVERIFIRPVYLGEHCLPFRMEAHCDAVIPYDGVTLLSGTDERIDRYPGLAEWWRHAERVWVENRSSEKRTLLEQINYIHQLSSQFPISALRVVYTKAGNHLTAAIVTDPNAVISERLYWGSASSLAEAHFLTAILNSPVLAEIVEPYQSRGAFGPRDFDKYVWYPPIPEYDEVLPEHRALSALGASCAELAQSVQLPPNLGFQAARRFIRESIEESGAFANIDKSVREILATNSAGEGR